MSYSVLVVDDNIDHRENIRELLEENGYRTFPASDGEMALNVLNRENPDGMILDMNLPKMNGWEVLEKIEDQIQNGLLVIIITAFGDIPLAVDAIKKGAFDFFDKPFNNEKLLLSVKNGFEKLRIQVELKELKTRVPSSEVSPEDFGPGKNINRVLANARKVAETDYSILIEGPTGSGKNLLARYIHQQSLRKEGPFVNVDCGTISGTLIESELFGHVKGSFTNAYDTKEGKFRAAHNGTLVLDEIGNIPLEQQVKFLRAVEEKKISPIGSNKEYDVDFRLIVATLENLEQLVKKGKFRRDLFYRIAEFTIFLPPLAEREEDIVHLTRRFILQCNSNLNKQISTELSDSVIDKLKSHTWPGNVRELQHVVSTAVLMAKGRIKTDNIIFRGLSESGHGNDNKLSITYQNGIPLRDNMNRLFDEIERQYIVKALELADNNKSKAADIFGVERRNFYNKLKKYGLDNN